MSVPSIIFEPDRGLLEMDRELISHLVEPEISKESQTIFTDSGILTSDGYYHDLIATLRAPLVTPICAAEVVVGTAQSVRTHHILVDEGTAVTIADQGNDRCRVLLSTSSELATCIARLSGLAPRTHLKIAPFEVTVPKIEELFSSDASTRRCAAKSIGEDSSSLWPKDWSDAWLDDTWKAINCQIRWFKGDNQPGEIESTRGLLWLDTSAVLAALQPAAEPKSDIETQQINSITVEPVSTSTIWLTLIELITTN